VKLPEDRRIVRSILVAFAAITVVAVSIVFIAPLFISTESLQKRALATERHLNVATATI